MTDIAVTDNCKNPDSYGEICVRCNKCGRFGEQKMTRAEAIKIFREWIDEGFPFDGGYAVEELADDEKEACNMAISALEQEPCETSTDEPMTMVYPTIFCDDAISREAVTNGEVVKKIFPHYDIEIDEHKGYVRVFYEDFYTTYPWKWWNANYKGDMPSVQTSRKVIPKEKMTKEEVITDLYWLFGSNLLDKGSEDTVSNAIYYLNQPSRRKGHWIHLRSDMYECSECGKTYTSFEMGKCDADYCPKCGSYNRGDENGNE